MPYPDNIDSLPLFSNGTGISSTINAKDFNNIISAITAIENHTKSTVLFFDSADRKRICVSGYVVGIVGGTSSFTEYLVPTLQQLAYLNNDLRTSGVMVLADTVHLTGTDDCTTNVTLTQNLIIVETHRTDPTQTFSGGNYAIMVTILSP